MWTRPATIALDKCLHASPVATEKLTHMSCRRYLTQSSWKVSHGTWQWFSFRGPGLGIEAPWGQISWSWPWNLCPWPWGWGLRFKILALITGWGKIKYPNTKIAVSQKCLNIFAQYFAHLFGTILCTNVLLSAVFTWHMSTWRKRKVQERISQLSWFYYRSNWATIKYHRCCDVIIFMFTCNIAL